MTLPQILPDTLPPWAQLGVLVLAALLCLALLATPFAVFGLKERLDLLEAQLDDIQADLRMLAMRLEDQEPEPKRRRRPSEPNEAAPHERSEPRLRWPSGR